MTKKKQKDAQDSLGMTELPEEHPEAPVVDEMTGLPPTSNMPDDIIDAPDSKLSRDPDHPERLGSDLPTDGEGKALGVNGAEDEVAFSRLKIRSVRPGFRAAGYAFTSDAIQVIEKDALTPEQYERLVHAEKHNMLKIVRE